MTPVVLPVVVYDGACSDPPGDTICCVAAVRARASKMVWNPPPDE
jgi:hypothetical protein